MNPEELILFTNKFPYEGGETFLETEIHHLARAFHQVRICPLEKGEQYYGPLPANVVVVDYEENNNFRIRDALTGYGLVILRKYLQAIFKSRYSIKYVTQFSYNWNTLMGFIRRSAWMMKQFKPEQTGHNKGKVFYSYWFNEWASALAIARNKGLAGRFIVRAHGYDYDELQNGRGYFPFRESEITQFHKIIQISTYGLAIMRSQYPDAGNMVLNRLGVRDGGYNAGSSAGEKFQIVSCSNFVPLKRIPLLIDILAGLRVPFEWTHFGAGAGMAEAEEYAAAKLKPGDYRFMGFVKNQSVLSYYQNNPVDLFVNTSILEGIPVSMMEAIAAGIPVAGFNVCGIPEIVTKASGLLLNVNDSIEETAGKLDHFLAETVRIQEFRTGVKAFWNGAFNADINYAEFIKTINQSCVE